MITVDEALWALERGEDVAAFRALRAHAVRGERDAFHMFGYLYDVGRGVKSDKKAAIYWYRRAYRNGWSIAASNIATIYREKRRLRTALRWYERAAALGDGDAHVEIAIFCYRGMGIRPDIRRARKHLKAAASSQNITPGGKELAIRLGARLRKTAGPNNALQRTVTRVLARPKRRAARSRQPLNAGR